MIVDLQAEIDSLAAKIAETQKKIDEVKAAIDVLVASNEKLQTDVHNTSLKNHELCANINDLTVRSNAISASIAVLKNDSECMKKSNGVEDTPYICSICGSGSGFKSERGLKQHMHHCRRKRAISKNQPDSSLPS